MKRFPFILLLMCLVFTLTNQSAAQWQNVAPGIDYQEFTISGPNNLFVARMDRDNTDCTIDSMIARGVFTGQRETIPSMASRYDGTINYWGQSWGQRNDVVIAINGDFYTGDGIPIGGQITSGWYARRFSDFTGGSGFVWQLDREAFIGECVRHIASKQKVSYPGTGQDQNFQGINTARGTDELIIYTHHKGLTTGTNNYGTEVLVQLTRPLLLMPSPNGVSGTVVEIHQDQGATRIPFDHVVLSGHGSAATKLLQNCQVGSEVLISQEIKHYERDCSTSLSLDWTKTYSSIGSGYHFLENGVVRPGSTDRHPRTAIALNDDYIFFVVVDGRSSESIGMTMEEIGNFCLNYLSATEGLNQDGGGSSTMLVNGEVMNVPSDGAPRAVANGLMMLNVAPSEYSPQFTTGDTLRTYINTSARIGPGLNYSAFVTISPGTEGVILNHDLNGILAKEDYWWWCEFNGIKGWFSGTYLQKAGCPGDFDQDGILDSTDAEEFIDCIYGPTLTLHPLNPCLLADNDSDRDVDLEDFAAFQWCFEGP